MEDSERHRILLIDGDLDLLTRMKVLLADEGHDVTAAWGGTEARELASSKGFDVVLLSDHLPDMDGRELWRLLRQLPSNAELALIRGSDPMTGDVRALLRGCAEHCVLPRTAPAQIASAIFECLRQKATSASLVRGVNAWKAGG